MKQILYGIAVLTLTVALTAQSPNVQAHLEPARGVLVGQPIRLVVSVYVPNYFTGSPRFPEFEIENAILILPQDRPENSNIQRNGVSYAGITETYVIYPQQAGDFRLPPAKIEVPYAISPPKSTTVQVSLPPLSFHAEVPAAARDLDYFLPTTSLTIQQSWSSPLIGLRAGDSVERTITVTATRMQAMLIPPLPLESPDGIHIYPGEPVVRDQKTDRGDFIYGRRTQTAKYLIKREGDYALPPIQLRWWDLLHHRLVTTTLPGVHITAVANPGRVELPPSPEPSLTDSARRVNLWKRYSLAISLIGALALTLCLIWAGYSYLPPLVEYYKAWQEDREHSEPTYFRNLQRACLRNNANEAYAWLLKWRAWIYPNRSVEGKLESLALQSEVAHLGAALFAENGMRDKWQGTTLASLLKQERKSRHRKLPKRKTLSTLNPNKSDNHSRKVPGIFSTHDLDTTI